MRRYSVEGSGPDCKSGVTDSVGSIPTRRTIGYRISYPNDSIIMDNDL